MTGRFFSVEGLPRYIVEVSDCFHPYSHDDCYTAGHYARLEEAIDACKRIVMESLAHCSNEIRELTTTELLSQYQSFGEDPFILDTVTSRVTDNDGVPLFSAWKYAEQMASAVVMQMKAK